MRHRKNKKILDRSNGPREALIRGLATSVVLYENVIPLLAKAKVVRPFVEKLITAGRRKSLETRRNLQKALMLESAVNKVPEELGPRYATRQGGYTRIIKLGRRKGDGGDRANSIGQVNVWHGKSTSECRRLSGSIMSLMEGKVVGRIASQIAKLCRASRRQRMSCILMPGTSLKF